MDSMAWSKGLGVQVGGHGVVSHAGSAATRLLADRTGLTGALSGALAQRGFAPVHDRGRVLVDLTVAIADGAATIGEIDTLRHQGDLFGPVASDTTVWRALAGCAARPGPGQQGPGEGPPSRLGPDPGAARRVSRPGPGRDLGEVIVVRLDATIVVAHSANMAVARAAGIETWHELSPHSLRHSS